jgi:hypothetical protein
MDQTTEMDQAVAMANRQMMAMGSLQETVAVSRPEMVEANRQATAAHRPTQLGLTR